MNKLRSDRLAIKSSDACHWCCISDVAVGEKVFFRSYTACNCISKKKNHYSDDQVSLAEISFAKKFHDLPFPPSISDSFIMTYNIVSLFHRL